MSWTHISILMPLLAIWAVFRMARNTALDIEERVSALENEIKKMRFRDHKYSRFVYDKQTGDVLEVPDILNRPEAK